VTVNGTTLYKNGTVQVLPMLAKSWNSSTDGKTWTFFLQKGVNFSDGNPLNSYQVWGQMYGLYYLTANNSGWAVGYNVFNMNASNFGPSTISLMTQSGLVNPNSQLLAIMSNSSWPIYVHGPNEIVFNLKAPFQWFPQMWVQFTGLIFDTQFVLQHGGFGTPGAINSYFNTNPIPGTGPYTVTHVVENSYVQFTQNPNYWAKNWTAAEIKGNPYMDPGHVKNVVVQAKNDDVARYVDLSSGSVQIAAILSQDWSQVASNSKFSYYQMPNSSANIVGLAMNTQRFPTNITAFRQAVVHAINYTAISDEAYLGTQGGGLQPMVGPGYPPFTQLYDLGGLQPYQYNVTLAEADLKASGVNVATIQPLEFRIIQGCGTCATTAQIVQNDLSAIGIPVNVLITTPSQYGPPYVAGAGTYEQEVNSSQTIAQLMWFGTATFAPDEPTPADSWLTWVSNRTAANNYAIYSNPTVQTCVDDLTNGTPLSALTAACTAAQKQIYNDAPYVWLGNVKLFFGGGSIVYNNQVVKGFLADPVFSGQSATAIFNTVTFVNGQS
jgi:ABC-type transport system substrate-binding protein